MDGDEILTERETSKVAVEFKDFVKEVVYVR